METESVPETAEYFYNLVQLATREDWILSLWKLQNMYR
jgi:hypothetical protein